jgi:hypothetical protein
MLARGIPTVTVSNDLGRLAMTLFLLSRRAAIAAAPGTTRSTGWRGFRATLTIMDRGMLAAPPVAAGHVGVLQRYGQTSRNLHK